LAEELSSAWDFELIGPNHDALVWPVQPPGCQQHGQADQQQNGGAKIAPEIIPAIKK
jgi:hypothetical protein